MSEFNASPVVVAPVTIKLLNTSAAAKVLGVSHRTVQNLISSCQLRSIKVGRSRRIPVGAIDDFTRNGAAVVEAKKDDRQFFLDSLVRCETTLDAKFANKLWQTMAAHEREVVRRESGDKGSPAYLASLKTFWAMAALLTSQHLESHDRKKAEGLRWSHDERRATRFLNAALDGFSVGLDELQTRFGKSNFDDLAKRIWFAFYNVTVEEATMDAEAIRSLFSLKAA